MDVSQGTEVYDRCTFVKNLHIIEGVEGLTWS